MGGQEMRRRAHGHVRREGRLFQPARMVWGAMARDETGAEAATTGGAPFGAGTLAPSAREVLARAAADCARGCR